jgi:hypothetical protein
MSIISDKQKESNQRNAEHSTGPKTPAGKDAVRFNALTWSSRAQSSSSLHAKTPQTKTEHHYLEQMVVARWLLKRAEDSERSVYDSKLPLEKELALLDRVSVRRVRLERSFTTAMHELERMQANREAQHQPAVSPHPRVAASPSNSNHLGFDRPKESGNKPSPAAVSHLEAGNLALGSPLGTAFSRPEA